MSDLCLTLEGCHHWLAELFQDFENIMLLSSGCHCSCWEINSKFYCCFFEDQVPYFPLDAPSISSLSLIFSNLITICLGIVFLVFLCLSCWGLKSSQMSAQCFSSGLEILTYHLFRHGCTPFPLRFSWCFVIYTYHVQMPLRLFSVFFIFCLSQHQSLYFIVFSLLFICLNHLLSF